MIGLDTNVLVRIFAADNPKQTAIARRFMQRCSADDPAFVSAVVVVEVSWVLSRTYGFSVASIRDALEWLFESSNIVVQRHDLLRPAIDLAAKRNADISDSIIAALAADAGASKTVTFDQPAARLVPGMELLK
ncbi:MAG: PIN domain-containing protein [Devosia sp.]|jgi:predicted nucleic-acid-binding protein|nr:PIN domain-containing protein [Devosia sp.]